MRCLVVVLVAAMTSLPVGGSVGKSPCKYWEFRCENERCLSPNRFCDGTDDCGDSSDEPPGCTNCNQSLMGEVGTKYPLRITEPFQRNPPFACTLHLVAGGGTTMGERLEITFLSFQIGSLVHERNESEDRLGCPQGHLRLSESHEDIFLGDDGSRKPTLRSQQTRGFSQLISAFKEPRQLSTLYDDYTSYMEPNFGYFCGSLISSNLGVAFYSAGNNVTLSVYLPSRSSVTSMMGSFGLYLTYRFLAAGPPADPEEYLGNPVANTYCDRTFVNCDKKQCIIRSPNFPGLYLRNFTCSYFIRQDRVPSGKRAHIVVSQPNEYKISVNTGSAVVRTEHRKALNQRPGAGLSTECAGDVVCVFDGIGTNERPPLAEFCESGTLPEVASSSSQMTVRLHSAPANHLAESRLELRISVKLVNEDAPGEMRLQNGRCEAELGPGRTGTVTSPGHSLPRNTTCLARLRGRAGQRIWLYFVSFFMRDGGLVRFSTGDVFDERTPPALCARAADYDDWVPRRPCLPPSEAYLSPGPELDLEYSFTKGLLSSASSFSLRYEYVDEDVGCGEAIGATSGAVTSPGSVFLYGRGGRASLSCVFRFELSSGERLKLWLERFRSVAPCSDAWDPQLRRHDCRFAEARRRAWIALSEETVGQPGLFAGCLCEAGAETTFDAFAGKTTVEAAFEVRGMTSFEDARHFGFVLRYEKWRRRSEEASCDPAPDASNRTSGGELTLRASREARCRWVLRASIPEARLFVQLRGAACSPGSGERALAAVYGPGEGPLRPRTVVCEGDRLSEVMSSPLNDSSWSQNNATDALVVEVLAPQVTLRWLEVTPPVEMRPQGRRLQCPFECPELSACINPELWCDGIVHCPHTGHDEDSCRTDALYLAIGLGGLAACAGALGLAAYILARRTRSAAPQKTHPFDKGYPPSPPVVVVGRTKKHRPRPPAEVRFVDNLHM